MNHGSRTLELPEILARALADPDASSKKAATARWKKEAPEPLQTAARTTLKAGIGNQAEAKALERIEAFAAATDVPFAAAFASSLSRLVKRGQSFAVVHDAAFAEEFFVGCLDQERNALNLYNADLELTSLPDTLVKNLAALHARMPFDELFFHGLALTDLPGALATLAPSIKKLNLNYAHVVDVPAVVWQLTALEHLELYIYPLERIGEGIGALTQLKAFTIGNAKKLKKLPAAAFALPLEELKIFETGITALDGLAQLKTLRRLDVRAPNLKHLDGLGQLQDLEELTLHHSKLTELPDEVYALPRLKSLQLSWTAINIGVVRSKLGEHVTLHTQGGR